MHVPRRTKPARDHMNTNHPTESSFISCAINILCFVAQCLMPNLMQTSSCERTLLRNHSWGYSHPYHTIYTLTSCPELKSLCRMQRLLTFINLFFIKDSSEGVLSEITFVIQFGESMQQTM